MTAIAAPQFFARSFFAQTSEKSKVGGQALIEGVMMRSENRIAWAVRKPAGDVVIASHPFLSVTKKIAVLGLPVIRGVAGLFESMVWGYKALSQSADIAMAEEAEKKDDGAQNKSTFADKILTALSFVLAFAISISLFMYAPMWVASQVSGLKDNSPFLFNLMAGGVRITLLLIYLAAISMWSETRRLFEYHGAEHKTIHAFEDGKELTVENISPYTTVHPRCGTSFLVIVALCAIFMASVIDTLHIKYIGEYANLFHRFGIRFIFVPLLAGVSYELLKFSAKHQKSKIINIIIQPGLWVQRITTKKPDNSQIEVAVKALGAAL